MDSGNSSWGKHVAHFAVVYSTTSCSGGNLEIDYHPAGSVSWVNVAGGAACVAGAKTTLDIPLDLDAWGLSVRNNAASTTFVVYEVQFWTTN